MTEDRVDILTKKGYDKVYVWDAEPNEDDPDHAHPFDTHLEVLGGEIEIGIAGTVRTLRLGDSIDIPRDTVHYGKAGTDGCQYIVAERH